MCPIITIVYKNRIIRGFIRFIDVLGFTFMYFTFLDIIICTVHVGFIFLTNQIAGNGEKY